MADFSQRVTQLSGCSRSYVLHSDEFDLARQCDQERNLIHKEYISYQGHRLLKTLEIPRDFQRFQKPVTLVADVFFVNKIPFLITLSSKIKFVTV